MDTGNPFIGFPVFFVGMHRGGQYVINHYVFYKIDEENKKVVVYAVVDGRQDYLNIIRGL